MLETANSLDSTERTRQTGRAALAARRNREGNSGSQSNSALSRLSASVNRRFNRSQPEADAPRSTSNSGLDSQGFIKPLPISEADAGEQAPQAQSSQATQQASARPDIPPPTSALTAEAARSERAKIGLAAVAASRASASRRANVVQGRETLSALRDTSTGVRQFSSGVERADGGRRSTSLFDLPSSGQGLVSRLRAQVRPSSPLNGLRGDGAAAGSIFGAPSAGLGSATGLGSGRSSLSAANAQRAGLRSASNNADSGSRLLLSASTPSRTSGGFGLAAPQRSAFDLIG